MTDKLINDLSEPLFASAAAAVAFALNFTGQNYQKAAINRMFGAPGPVGKGLGGLDGAAQAGMIKAELAAVGLLGEAIIVAEMAPKTRPCDCKALCCSGEITNPEWAASIGVLSNVAKELKICPAYMNVRANLLRRFFGVDLEITEIAKMCGVSRDTVSTHNSKLVSTFTALKKKAWADFDARLVNVGMIEGRKKA
jgi:hypothetical protein